jgi:hypothetical protein
VAARYQRAATSAVFGIDTLFLTGFAGAAHIHALARACTGPA